MVWDFIVQYWLQFFLGLIASGVTALAAHFYKLYKNEQKRKRSELDNRFIEEVKELINDNNKDVLKVVRDEEIASAKADKRMDEQMQQIQSNLAILTEGMLSIQGKQFKDECRMLLRDDHVITLQEFEGVTNEHRIYNILKGNHEGDSLYSLVKVKYEAGLAH